MERQTRPPIWCSLRRARGFTLIELLVVIGVVVLLLAILLPALREARSAGRLTVCTAGFQQFGRAHGSYASDHKELIAALTGNADDPENRAGTGFPHHFQIAAQVQTLINTRDLRRQTPLEEFQSASGVSSGSGPSVAEQFEHFALIGYISDESDVMPDIAVCPEDVARREWRANPYDPASWGFRPRKPANRANEAWLPYSSSYQLVPAAATYIFHTWGAGQWSAYDQTAAHDGYQLYKVRFGSRRMSEVTFPAQKVAIMDSQQRHHGEERFFAYANARQPLLFFDGSASIRTTGDANKGWKPALPEAPSVSRLQYVPDVGFESAAGPAAILHGSYKWTRGGLRGIDFGGGEVRSAAGESRAYYAR